VCRPQCAGRCIDCRPLTDCLRWRIAMSVQQINYPAGEHQNVVCESEAVRHLIDGLEMVHRDVVVSVVCPRIVCSAPS
jgi:rhodanese-related sulfurtransferase